MCGRYFVEEDVWERIEGRFPEMRRELPKPPAGDMTPGMNIGSILRDQIYKEPVINSLRWGFPAFDKRKILINARAESVLTKPTFQESFRVRRCLLPASGFYEWDKQKTKITFTIDEVPIIFLGGIYRPYGDEDRFVIITREANASMQPYHDRMPLMIAEEEMDSWLSDHHDAKEILAKPLPTLRANKGLVQLSLFNWRRAHSSIPLNSFRKTSSDDDEQV